MDVGIPVEQSTNEFRVGLTPQGVRLITQEGHRCYIERGAGLHAGFQDTDYQRPGGTIVYSAAEVYGRADMMLKVDAPTTAELELMREGQAILAFWHLAAKPKEVVQTLADKRITAIAYEMIQTDDGRLPVLQPLSQIAGRMAPQIAARWLQNDGGGVGLLIGGVIGIPPIDVLVIGAGEVGVNTAMVFKAMGARVFLMDQELERLQTLEKGCNGSFVTMVSYDFNIERVLKFAHVVVGAVLVPGQRTPVLVPREMVRAMRPRSVIIDISIDQGGCFETSRPTTLANPVFIEENVIHYCVPNLTSAVARTATHAYLNAAWPYGQLIPRLGIEEAIRVNTSLMRGVAVHNGQVLHTGIADSKPVSGE
jgi:alanine dehydrogenase